jgi:hypothetical protein
VAEQRAYGQFEDRIYGAAGFESGSLDAAFGAGHRFELGPREAGGTIARIDVPFVSMERAS